MVNALAFVDSIAASPATLLNLNDSSVYFLDEFDAPPPQLRRASSSTMLYDGELVSAAAYENRTVHVSWVAPGTADATATAIQNLHRQLDQSSSLLRWLPHSATSPIFFRTLRSTTTRIEEKFNSQGIRSIEADILAEPFGYGIAETGSVTINNDPAHATNPCFYRFGTTVKGDVATPLYLELGAATDLGGRTVLLTSQALGFAQTQTAPILMQSGALSTAEQGDGFGAWSTGSGDAAMSAGNYARWTSAVGVLNVGLIDAAGLLTSTLVGEYRLMVRVRASDTTTSWIMRASIMATIAGAVYTAPDVTYTRATNGPHWLDLGVFRFPYGAPPVDTTFGTSHANSGISFRLSITNPNLASKTFDVDCFMLVPVGVDQAISTTTAFLGFAYDRLFTASTIPVVDGYQDVVYTVNASSQYDGAGVVPVVGQLPTLSPGEDNSIHLLRSVGVGYNAGAAVGAGGTGVNDALTASTAVTWKYFPRYLYARPATT